MISAIVICTEDTRFLSQTIQSLIKQSCPPDEIIVVGGKIPKDIYDPKVKHLPQDEPYHSAKYKNAGLKAVSPECQYVMFAESNDVIYKDKIARSKIILDSCPYVGLVYSDYEIWDLDNNRQVRNFCVSYDMRLLGQMNIINGTSLIRKSSLDKTGQFDEKWRYVSDYDMWLRMSKDNIAIHDPESLFCMRIDRNHPLIKDQMVIIEETKGLLSGK